MMKTTKKTVMMIVIIAIIAIITGCNNNQVPKEPLVYTNPVFSPVLADPGIIEHEGVFYVYGTQDYGEWGDDFGTKYGPILSSPDLVNWTYEGSVFEMDTRPTWGTANAGIWAPDVVKINDQFVMYYSLSKWGDPNPGIGVATAEHPLGPWIDHGMLIRSDMIGVNNSIDATVFLDGDRVYMIWGSFRGLYGLELTADGLALKDGSNAVNTKTHIAGLDTSTSWNGATYEGAYVIKKDDYFYMFVSSGTCCNGFNSTYNVRVSRSLSPLGPYTDHNGQSMLGTYRGYPVVSGSTFFAGPGHNSIAQDDKGDYYIVYHAFDKNESEKYGNSPRRSLMIDKLVWDDQGWPSVNGGIPSNGETDGPFFK